MVDRGIGTPPQNQGGEDAHFLRTGFWRVPRRCQFDYLSSFVFRIAFTDVYTQAIDSEVRSQIFLSNTTNGFHFNGLAERYQNSRCACRRPRGAGDLHHDHAGGVGAILHTPSFFISGEERQLGNTPLYGRSRAR